MGEQTVESDAGRCSICTRPSDSAEAMPRGWSSITINDRGHHRHFDLCTTCTTLVRAAMARMSEAYRDNPPIGQAT